MCPSRCSCRSGTKPATCRDVSHASPGRTKFLWSTRRARMARPGSRKSWARGWCNSSSTAPGRRRKTGRWRICRFGTNGSLFSMPTRCCRRSAEEEFRRAIAEAGELAGYWINRRFMFMGRWLEHAYYPNWNLRLFRHSLGRYEKLTDAVTESGDNEVHEHVVVQGPTGRLALRAGSLRVSVRRGFRRETQPLLELGGARRGR